MRLRYFLPPKRVVAAIATGGDTSRMNVVVVGLGYVGAVTAACLSKLGHTVVGVDIDPHKLEPLERGVSPIVEPGLDELVATGGSRPTPRVIRSRGVGARRRRRPRVRRDAGPERRHRRPRLRRAGDRGARRRHREPVVVSRDRLSQHRPPGTVDGRLRPILERASGRRAGRRLRRRHGARVPPRRKRGRRLLRSAFHCRRRPGRPDARAREGGVRRYRAACPPAFDRGGRVAQVRVQRIPRGEDHVRERDRAPPLGGRRRHTRRHAGVLRGPTTSTSPLHISVPASRSAVRACRRTCAP